MPTEITVITLREQRDPAKEIHLPSFMAKSPAMKKVLSPISLRKIREKAARKPLLPRGPLTRRSFNSWAEGAELA